MRSFIILPLVALCVSAFLWFSTRGRPSVQSQEPTAGATPVISASIEQSAAPEASEAPGPATLNVIKLPSCSLLPIQEQNVASPIDGLLLEVMVKLGQKVEKGQNLARLDDSKLVPQLHLLEIRAAGKSEELIAEAQFKEADARVKYAEAANRRDSKAVPELEVKTYLAQRQRFEQEIQKAREDRLAAQKEVDKLKVLLSMHQITSLMEGEVVKISKRDGEALKQAETLLTIARTDRLRIEGFCKAHHASHLRLGGKVQVEPEIQGAQRTELIGHTDTVSDLAISADGKVLASASKDGTVILWSWPDGRRLGTLPHASAVAAVDVVPWKVGKKITADYLVVTAADDGKVRGWSLTAGKVKGPLWTGIGHGGAVTCVRIQADGKGLISGGEDRKIGVWDIETGKHEHWIHQPGAWRQTAHQGAVTDLQFGLEGMLTSCGSDNVLKVWNLSPGNAALLKEHRGRSGDVARLGAAPNGSALLFDHGEELRLLHPRTGNVLGAINGGKGVAFQGFASFSPSGRLLLTQSADGRCQVWQTPREAPETKADLHSLGMSLGGQEIRHYRLPRSAEMKCGIFAPDEKAFFTGGSDRTVRAWVVPEEKEWKPRVAFITHVASTLEPGTDLVRIQAEMDNQGEAMPLRAGTFVQLKIYPNLFE